VEAREEAEMLRLQLDGAKEERAGALRPAAAAQARPQWEKFKKKKKEGSSLWTPGQGLDHQHLHLNPQSI